MYLTGAGREAGKLSVDSTRTHARAHTISGKTISKKWHMKLEKHHQEILKACPAKLDLEHAQNFNKASIGDFYEKYKGKHFRFDGTCASLLLAIYL